MGIFEQNTLYLAAKTFFTITKLTSEEVLETKTPPMEVTSFSILTLKNN